MAHAHAVNCGNHLCDICYQSPTPSSGVDILAAFNADDWRSGQLQIIQYWPRRKHSRAATQFTPQFLSRLWTHLYRDRSLARVFCGMTDLSHDAVLQYLIGRPLFAAVRWTADNTRFHVLGFGWIGQWVGVLPSPSLPSSGGPRSCFAAYAFLKRYWGDPDLTTLALLGIGCMFNTYNLTDMFGQRYGSNVLTARFMTRIGFEDAGVLPRSLLTVDGNGTPVLVDSVVSQITRQVIVHRLENLAMSMLG